MLFMNVTFLIRVVGMSVEDASDEFNADDWTNIFLLASISTNGALYSLMLEI
jgi:hypothetical protein